MAACPRCGEPNPKDARFCNACGAALAQRADPEVRKTVTILFADVAGSTALGEQLDPESLRRVMARYFEAARGCLERHGGTVEKFIGDAVMAVFGVPTVHEDDAVRALRAAVDLGDALDALNVELVHEYGVSLLLRIGVNTGEVVTGTDERLATGDAVNVAARLEQAARPGEVLIGEPTRRLSGGAAEVEPVEPLSLRGKAEPLPAHRLLRVIDDALAFGRRPDGPLVGRRMELARMRAAFDRTVSARRCLVLTLLGPPGIGKSRLARELAAALAGEATVLSGRCLPYGEGITYWPLVEIFREAGAEDDLAAAMSAGAPEEISWAVRKALERLARERPVVLVVEDLHWAESTLLDLLEHLVDWTRDAPLLLVCLARLDLLDLRPGWAGRSEAETLMLDALSPAESDELIDGLRGGSELSAYARARVRQVASGNPLFVEQLLAMLGEGGGPDDVPPTIQALLAGRLDALPTEERGVLERAAVVGLEFDWEALGELAPDGRRPPGARLAALVRKEFIQPHEAVEDTFRFRHMLIRDSAYERIPREARSDLHERVAGWLGGRGEEFEEVVAYHLEQAYLSLARLGRPGARARSLAEAAAERLSACGQRAYARGDSEAAVNMLTRAAAVLPADDPRRLSLLPPLGRALREYGDLERADEVLSEAVARARATCERTVAADAGVALSDLRFHRSSRTGVERRDVLRGLDAAIPVFEEAGDESGLARALTLLGKLNFWAGEAATALPDLERAARHARAVGDRAQEAESLRYVCHALQYGPVPVAEALGRLEEIGPRAEGNSRLEAALLLARAHLEAMRGRFDAAHELVSRAKVVTEEHGLRGLLDWQAFSQAGRIALLAGDPATAEQELRRACEGIEGVGELGFLSSVAPLLVDSLYLQGGRDREALLLTERWRPDRLTVPQDVDAQVAWRRVRAKLLARTGELEEAERLAREGIALVAPADHLELRARTVADLGEVLRLAGRPQESRQAFEEAVALFEAKGNVVAASRLHALLGGSGNEARAPDGAGKSGPSRR
jgi:class 3 adenylate cyclase/tetratricopeptide (TPR) repeat protein